MLSKYAPDVKVDVYESTARFSDIGAGVSLQWRSRRLVAELGLADDISGIGGQLDSTLRMLSLIINPP
jgi:salicylate hydroxylase